MFVFERWTRSNAHDSSTNGWNSFPEKCVTIAFIVNCVRALLSNCRVQIVHFCRYFVVRQIPNYAWILSDRFQLLPIQLLIISSTTPPHTIGTHAMTNLLSMFWWQRLVMATNWMAPIKWKCRNKMKETSREKEEEKYRATITVNPTMTGQFEQRCDNSNAKLGSNNISNKYLFA